MNRLPRTDENDGSQHHSAGRSMLPPVKPPYRLVRGLRRLVFAPGGAAPPEKAQSAMSSTELSWISLRVGALTTAWLVLAAAPFAGRTATAQSQGPSEPKLDAPRAPYPLSKVIASVDWGPKETIVRKASGSDNRPVMFQTPFFGHSP